MNTSKLSFLLLVLTAVTSFVGSAVALPSVIDGPTVNPANGHIYSLLAASSWTDAEAKAVALGGHLATVNNQAEDQWIYSTFGYIMASEPDGLWIGLNDVALEGTFVWASGEPLVYTNWGVNTVGDDQPDNGPGNNEDYGLIWNVSEQSGTWNDTNDTNWPGTGNLPYGVVEVIPEPATVGLLVVGGLVVLRRRRLA